MRRHLLGTAVLLAVVSSALPARAQPAETGDLAAPLPEVPVRFRGETLFVVRSSLGDMTPVKRATAVEERLAEIAAGSADVVASVRVEERDRRSDVYAGDAFVASVTDVDARPTGRTRRQLAADQAARIRETLRQEFKGRSAKGVAVALLLTILASLVLYGLLALVRRSFPPLLERLRDWERRRVRGLRLQGLELLSATQVSEALIRAATAARVLVVVTLVAVYVQSVLGFFPWTRDLAERLFTGVTSALWSVVASVGRYLPNLIVVALIAAGTVFVVRFLRALSGALRAGTVRLRGFDPEWAAPTFELTRFVVLAFAAIVAFPYLPGSASPALLGVAVFIALPFALGAVPAASNLVAGVVLTYMRPFTRGDRVRIGETAGEVLDVTPLVVRVRTADATVVTLPNSLVLKSPMTNLGGGSGSVPPPPPSEEPTAEPPGSPT